MSDFSILVPAEELRRLTEGSFENRVARVREAMRVESTRIFGKDENVLVLGTFLNESAPCEAVVISESGAVALVRFKESKQGVVHIVSSEKVPVRTYSEDKVDRYVRDEVHGVVMEWLAGKKVDVAKRLMDSVPLLSGGPVLSEDKVLVALATTLQAPRPWRAVLSERREAIRQAVGPLIESKDQDKSPKFRLLYAGGMPMREAEGYRDLVNSDLRYLTAQVESLGVVIESSYDSLSGVVRSRGLAEESVTSFLAFSEDLIADVSNLREVLSESVARFSKVESLGRLHDEIAGRLSEYELAGSFVKVMSQRLCEAGNQEKSACP